MIQSISTDPRKVNRDSNVFLVVSCSSTVEHELLVINFLQSSMTSFRCGQGLVVSYLSTMEHQLLVASMNTFFERTLCYAVGKPTNTTHKRNQANTNTQKHKCKHANMKTRIHWQAVRRSIQCAEQPWDAERHVNTTCNHNSNVQYNARSHLGDAKHNVNATFTIPCAEHSNVHYKAWNNSSRRLKFAFRSSQNPTRRFIQQNENAHVATAA